MIIHGLSESSNLEPWSALIPVLSFSDSTLRRAITLGDDCDSKASNIGRRAYSDPERGGAASMRRHGFRYSLSDLTGLLLVVAMALAPLSRKPV